MNGDRAKCLVAHRGYPARYPENSLEGLQAAARAGARYVEFDVQLCASGVPVLLHDEDLFRALGRDEKIAEVTLERLGAALPTLAEAVAYLGTVPGVTAFVEIKSESIRDFGRVLVVERIATAIAPLGERGVVISFDDRVIEQARDRRGGPIGWVIDAWDEATRVRAHEIRPDYLFTSLAMVPDGPDPFWPGPWRWAVYTIDEWSAAESILSRGAALVETDTIGTMLDP